MKPVEDDNPWQFWRSGRGLGTLEVKGFSDGL